MRTAVFALTASVASAVLLVDTRPAHACGCLSPPEVTVGDYAVNQQSEQIIFEVEPGWVTAHVLIKYAGDPASFAWIVPVPEIPELGISPASAFGFLDQLTQPRVTVTTDNICPQSEWQCEYHPYASCDSGGIRLSGDEDSSGAGSGGASPPGGPPVTVLAEQVIGDYQTVTFRADEANVATAWLRQNGFIVNQTTSIYMEPYVQQNMVFVAAKLLPGAGVKSIKPLKLRYRAAYPMVPLILTAVAAEPHLTVVSYVYGSEAFRPMGHPVITIDDTRIARDTANRVNYPAVLARTIDEAGGDGFAIEYRGGPLTPTFGGPGGCCDDQYNNWDRCGVRNDDQCQCPGTNLDSEDCSAQPELLEGIDFLKALAAKHGRLTRITTRVSAEEMTWDPTFEPHFEAPLDGLLQITGVQASLASCTSAIIDKDEFALIDAAQACAATYCGPHGRCVATVSGPACLCEPSFVAQRYTELDGIDAVTCVPRVATVDLRANGEQLPDACAGVSCGSGNCIDRNGIPVCACAAGKAAVAGPKNPNCEDIVIDTSTPGADDYSEPLRDLDVCAPPYPMCRPGGWLVKQDVQHEGVDCGGTQPPVWLTWAPPAPSCGDDIFETCTGCDSQTSGEGAPLMVLTMTSLVGIVVLRRRRRRPQA